MSDVDILAISSIVMANEEEIRADERRKFLTWLISEVAFDCYTCPVTACFYDKNAKCVDELIKKYNEQCSEPITDKFNEGRQQS